MDTRGKPEGLATATRQAGPASPAASRPQVEARLASPAATRPQVEARAVSPALSRPQAEVTPASPADCPQAEAGPFPCPMIPAGSPEAGLASASPVLVLSVNREKATVYKGIKHGACDYIVKPVNIKEIRNIWQHVVRKNHVVVNYSSSDSDDADQRVGQPVIAEGGAKSKKCSKKKRNDRDGSDENRESRSVRTTRKKPRVSWTGELHNWFLEVVNRLGIDRAVPKAILQMMNVHNHSRESVASHLQKYRLYLKRVIDDPTKPNPLGDLFERRNSSYMAMGQQVVPLPPSSALCSCGSQNLYVGEREREPPIIIFAPSSGEMAMFPNEQQQNQMGGTNINNTTSVGVYSEQMTPLFNMASNTAPVEMTNANFSPMNQMMVNGGSTSSPVPNLQAGNPVAPPAQMVNGGRSSSSAFPGHLDSSVAPLTMMVNGGGSSSSALPGHLDSSVAPQTQTLNGGEGASGILPVQDDPDEQEAPDDQPTYNTSNFLEDIFASMASQDFNPDSTLFDEEY
ncbi:hypothetical protein ACQ4PT_001120 [Festuca glaucescens]